MNLMLDRRSWLGRLAGLAAVPFLETTNRAAAGPKPVRPETSFLPATPVPPAAPVYVRPGEAVPLDLAGVKAEVNTLLKADVLLGNPARDPANVFFANTVNDARAGDLHRRVLKAILMGRGDPATLAGAALVTEEMYCKPGKPG